MENNILSVRMHGNPIGILELNSYGKMSFHYLKPYPENKEQLSHSLPLSMDKKIFSEENCRPFFEGLLPDSESAREAIARRYGISSRNTFRLLQAIGKECAGAISFHDKDEPPSLSQSEEIDVDYKTDEDIEALIKKLPINPLFMSEVRLSLAGVQNKACIYLKDPSNPINSPIGLPQKGSLSTHILKPEIEGFPNSAYNEYFCLRLARMIGLKAAKPTLRRIGNTPCLIVQRYDRVLEGQKVKRLHQEDFCQALGRLPSQKYQNEGGPSLEDCFHLLDEVSPFLSLDRIALVNFVFFNFIVGNTDAHGKNYSLLYSDHTLPRLAPLYDVLCCEVYESHSRKMAMKIGGHYLADDIFGRHWERFCRSVGLSFPGFKKQAQEMCERISTSMETIIHPPLTPEELEKIRGKEGAKHEALLRSYTPFAKQLQTIIQKNRDTFLKRLTC